MIIVEKIVNVETGEETVIERKASEVEQAEILEAQMRAEKSAEIANQQNQAKAALLDRLGITEDEAKLLLS